MGTYQFKLPDIGEGIAEAEIVAWHVKPGDTVDEDQQLADLMTDKATVEMESPVAGKVIEVAGEVGDKLAIGSVLAVIETDGAEAPAPVPESVEEVPLGDGLEKPTQAQEKKLPVMDVESPLPAREGPGVGASAKRERPAVEHAGTGIEPAPAVTHPPTPPFQRGEKALASPAVRQRARDLGIALAQVKTAGDRIRHS